MRCKKTIDARSYSHETLEQLRLDAVKRVEAGESPEAVATGLGINRRTRHTDSTCSQQSPRKASSAS
jgi:hypothetical protein